MGGGGETVDITDKRIHVRRKPCVSDLCSETLMAKKAKQQDDYEGTKHDLQTKRSKSTERYITGGR